MRLIDVDAVRDDFANAVYNELFEHKDNYIANTIIDIFCSLPKIEAEPVKHGKWLDYYRTGVQCPFCKESYSDEIFLMGDKINRCPNCGAKMNGGD